MTQASEVTTHTGTHAWLRSNGAQGRTSWITGAVLLAWLTSEAWGTALLCAWKGLR